MDGVVLLPSLLAITMGSLPSITETQEFVVPKSMPIILLISYVLLIFKLIFTVPFKHCAVC
jgi:hypothetical protein